MSKKRNVSFVMPEYLLDQIEVRAHVAGRSRNAEMRALVNAGLVVASGDFHLEFLPSPRRRAILWIEDEILLNISDRARAYGRSLGRELVRLMGLGIQKGVDRDLAIIAEMMSRQGLSAPSH
ncbi:MAG: hypothetical protein ACREEW_13260 [Caulobacteraceae bacterium]